MPTTRWDRGWVPAHPHQDDRKKKWSTCKESGTKIQSLQKNLHGGPSYPIIIIGFIIIMGCVVYFGYHYYTSHSGGGEGEGSTGGSSGSTTENVKDKPSWLEGVKGRAREGSKRVHWDSGKGKVKESEVTRSTVSGPLYKTEFNSLPGSSGSHSGDTSSAFDKNIKGTSWWSSFSKGWGTPTTEASTSTASGSTVVSTPSGSTVTSTPPSVEFMNQKVPIAPLPTLEDIHADIMRIVPSPESTPTQPVEP